MTITKTAHLPVSPADAFALITQPERLRRWLTVTSSVDLRAGGSYRWTVTPGHQVAGTFTEIDPGRRVVFGWGIPGSEDFPPDFSTITVTIEPDGAGSLVTLIHEGLSPDMEPGHDEGWTHFLERLEQVASTGDAGQDPWAASPADMDALSAAEAALSVLQAVLVQLTPEDQTNPTPCAEYDGHALAVHLMGSITGLGSLVGANAVDPEEGTLEDRISTMATTTLEAWHDHGLDGTVVGPFGPIPAEFAANILSLEFRVHGGDFAQSANVRMTASDELITYVLENARPIIDDSRTRGDFADVIDVAEDADPLDRLLAYAGRSPLRASV